MFNRELELIETNGVMLETVVEGDGAAGKDDRDYLTIFG